MPDEFENSSNSSSGAQSLPSDAFVFICFEFLFDVFHGVFGYFSLSAIASSDLQSAGALKTQDAAVHRAETPLEPALNMSSQPELEISHKSAQAGDVTQFRCNPWVCSEGFQRPSPHSRGKDRMKTIWPGEDLQLRLHGLEKIAVPVGHATLVPVKAVNRKILPSKVHFQNCLYKVMQTSRAYLARIKSNMNTL